MFVSISQVIGCEDRLRNDLYCVVWGVKLYSNQTTASRRYTGDIHSSTVVGLFMTPETMKATRTRRGGVHMFITHRLTLTLQLHNFDLFRSFCTVAWQLARFQLTRRIARSLGDSRASCFLLLKQCPVFLLHLRFPLVKIFQKQTPKQN